MDRVPKTEVVVGVLCQPLWIAALVFFGAHFMVNKERHETLIGNPVYEASGYTLDNACKPVSMSLDWQQYWILHSF